MRESEKIKNYDNSARNHIDLYMEQSNRISLLLTYLFYAAILLMIAENRHFDILKPFGMPGALSQAWYYGFGFMMLFSLKKKKGVDFPWWPGAGFLWVAGLFLASVFAVRPREAFPTALAVALYLVSGYGIWKASLDDRVLSVVLKGMALVAGGWCIFLLKVYFEYGYLPLIYKARLPWEYYSYDHTNYGLLIANGTVAAVALLINRQGSFSKLFIGIVISIAMFTIFISQCRSAILALVSSLVYLLLKGGNIQRRGQSIIKGAWILIAMMLVGWSVNETSKLNDEIMKRYDFADINYQLQSSSGRPELLRKGILLVAKHPIGVGGYNARFTSVGITELQRTEGFILHNQYLTMIAEGGWIVLITIIIFMKRLIIIPLKNKWTNNIRLGIFCCWLNQSIVCIFADNLGNRYFLMLFLASAVVALEISEKNNQARTSSAEIRTHKESLG